MTSPAPTITVQDALRAATARLRAADVPSPEVDARALLEHVLGLGAAGLLLRGAEALSVEQTAALEALLARRAAREPLQYLLGEVEWGGVRLHVDGRALVPRPETEWLLQLVLQGLACVGAPRVLDVGTGTGALALGVKAARRDARVTATDVSEGALGLARENALLNGLQVEFVQADLLEGVSGPFDLIVSNPPYLPEGDRQHCQPEVAHDPDLALYAGADGLTLARPLAAQAAGRLAPGAPLWLELDGRNAHLLAAELRAAGWRAAVHPDLAGCPRFVEARRPG